MYSIKRQLLPIVTVVLAPIVVWGQAAGTDSPSAGDRNKEPYIVPSAAAVRTQAAPAIDGQLDDAAWGKAQVINTFTQYDPDEGVPASEETEVRIVYDSEAIYIGARLHDRSPVTLRLGRRDMQNDTSDWLRVSLDSFRDHRTAFQFEVNPSGVRRDMTIVGSSISNLAWDPVWDAATRVDSGGWTAEMRIPFSQLRFTTAEEQDWGLQLERVIHRRQELSMFSFTPKSEQGGVATYAHLTGLGGMEPGNRLELIPYVMSQGRFAETPANTLVGDSEFDIDAGLDARYRVTSNLTLTTTVNPDFGQVEVDPAVINLTVFETRYEEKRPFFVEGASSFDFGGRVAGPSAAAASLFYSRRIGRAPQLRINADQVDAPTTSAILAAAKLSGKTANGWSLGILNALTGAEYGRYIDSQDMIQSALIEPRTNYFVGRVSRELRRGQSMIGGIFTSANRDSAGGDPRVDVLRSSAYTGGMDFTHEWANRSWFVSGFLIGSHVKGSEQAILGTQQSSARYYQRPDAGHLTFDPNATSMSGGAASVNMRKTAGLHWTTDSWVQMITPGFETNDVGYLQRSDRRAFGQGVTYSQRTPGRVLRSWSSTSYVNYAQNFGGDVIDHFYWTRLTITHLSYWQLSTSVWYEPERTDDRFTRGGPIAKRPAVWRYNATVSSDVRKPITGRVNLSLVGDRAGSLTKSLDLTVNVRTSPRWNLSIGPEFTSVRNDAQYVTAIEDPTMASTFGRRYIFAPLDQTEMSIDTRFNYTFTPNLSLEFYAQPLVSNGNYGTPKEFQTPREYDFAVYGEDLGTLTRNGNSYTVDPDGIGPIQSFSVRDRSFTTRSLRGNAVLRWEYRPGSTLYIVWQQNWLNPDRMEDFSVTRAFGTLFDGRANNVLAVKWTYWFNP